MPTNNARITPCVVPLRYPLDAARHRIINLRDNVVAIVQGCHVTAIRSESEAEFEAVLYTPVLPCDPLVYSAYKRKLLVLRHTQLCYVDDRVDAPIPLIGGQVDTGIQSVGTLPDLRLATLLKTGALEIIDLHTNEHDVTPVCTAAAERRLAALAVLRDGRVFIFGGHTQHANPAHSCIYDVSRMRWSRVSPTPVLLTNPISATLSDGRVFVAAGTDAFLYHPVNDEWHRFTLQRRDTPIHVYRCAALDDRILVVSAENQLFSVEVPFTASDAYYEAAVTSLRTHYRRTLRQLEARRRQQQATHI